MAFEYLPVMAQASAPKPPRTLVTPSRLAWSAIKKPVSGSRVALMSSAALRLSYQRPFTPREDLTYRLLPSGPDAGELLIDHHSGIGRVPRQDPEIIFPRTALAELAKDGTIASVSPIHVSFMGGLRCHKEVETDLAPSVAKELQNAAADLALLIPY
jgi:D-proline reductase (dithiol) PrdB